MFIDADEPLDFLSFLENTSRDCGIAAKVSSVSSLDAKIGEWPSIGFQITSMGSFPKFLRFLEKLESSIYPIEIQTLSINRLSKDEMGLKEFEGFSVGDIKADFLIKAYAKQ